MTQRVSGMDTDRGRETANQMDSHAQAVSGVVKQLQSTLARLPWDGPDRALFNHDVDTSITPYTAQTIEEMQQHAQLLRVHAERQDAASA